MKILIINGPNINMVGIREPEIYGNEAYAELCKGLVQFFKEKSIDVVFFQSNHEGQIIDSIQSALGNFDGIVINGGALSHYSYGIYDALLAVRIPAMEVHISNVYKRENFRHKSVIAAACVGQICGCGKDGYKMAVEYLSRFLDVK